MHERHGRRVTAREKGDDPSGALQLGVLLGLGRRLLQPPVQVQLLVNLAGDGIGPRAAGSDHNGRGAEEPLQELSCCLGLGVTLGRDAQPLCQGRFGRLSGVVESRNGRREYGRLARVRCLRGVPGRLRHRVAQALLLGVELHPGDEDRRP